MAMTKLNAYRATIVCTTHPNRPPALWLIIPTVEQGYPDWNQPVGGMMLIRKATKCDLMAKDYESLINANVWSPTAYPAGWKKL